MKSTTNNRLDEALRICDEEEKSTEYTIQFIMDYANVSHECVIQFLLDKTK